jgi:transposase InsO family protein
MNTIMDDEAMDSMDRIREFLSGALRVKFEVGDTREAYPWIQKTLVRFEYRKCGKPEKGLVVRYLQKITGYSRAQLFRLIDQYRKRGVIARRQRHQHRFPRVYTPHDIALLVHTDNLHNRLSGPATKKILEREYKVYGREEYKGIAKISPAHIYNLRKAKRYAAQSATFTKTRPVPHPFGERRKPDPQGRPGFIRVDSVHQGDKDKAKGVYHINLVDEVTQYELVVTVEGISEAFLHPGLEEVLGQFPFVILGFHSDNGSEFVNQTVAKLLNRLIIRFTKSRARHTNDNALVESKNGAVVRKQYGYGHIPRRWARQINQFNKDFFNVYINCHRPAFFPEIKTDRKGKEKRRYPYQKIATPYEKLKSLPHAETFLREGVTFCNLDALAAAMSDNQFAERMRKAESQLFEKILGPE